MIADPYNHHKNELKQFYIWHHSLQGRSLKWLNFICPSPIHCLPKLQDSSETSFRPQNGTETFYSLRPLTIWKCLIGSHSWEHNIFLHVKSSSINLGLSFNSFLLQNLAGWLILVTRNNHAGPLPKLKTKSFGMLLFFQKGWTEFILKHSSNKNEK